MASGCLTENQVQALLGGALPSSKVDAVETHLDVCLNCQLLVSAGVRTTSLRTHGLEAPSASGVHFSVGDVVSARYEITRFIARGGMGEVYAANDRMLSEEIALKVLTRPAAAGPGAFARMKAEVQLARRVTDPHVLRVFDIGSYQSSDGGEVLFLTMQLLRGETLRERLRRAGPLRPPEVWRLANDMFAALGAAHQIGIVHRDFKSENVMLVPTAAGPPRAVVMDFGLAQTVAADAPTQEEGTPVVAGTLGYMAPEQLSGGTVTAAADVFAFGVVLHEMLTGVLPPFRPKIARRGSPQPPPPLLLDTLDIPARWSALIRRCLTRDPAARFRNIIEAREAIARRSGLTTRLAVAAAVAAVAIPGVIYWKRASSDAIGGDAVVVSTPPPPTRETTAATAAAITSSVPVLDVRLFDEPDPLPKPVRARAHRSGVVARNHRVAAVDATPVVEDRAPVVEHHQDEANTPPTPIVDSDDPIDPFKDSR